MARLRSFRGDFYEGTLVILDIAREFPLGEKYYSGVLLDEGKDPEYQWVSETDQRIVQGKESHMYVSPFLKPLGGRVGLGTKLRDILEKGPVHAHSLSDWK
ncbi:hypothetical protein FLK61_38075 [Paenalkalicoccus suaedae]|uniref:Uncharacterized protein n=1 Tax=Paenalkalicoccus suaedae TaxID=2592382 RepID=A0A859FH42_9BACI|nr:hypothetical protein [Paenalkalicoccus suaedae]QKS72439.1 hypothetical protein FLK61_38075 [Paenalkalicoccus suaedae]